MRRVLSLRGSVLAVALAGVLVTVAAGPAVAHTRLVSSTPAEGGPVEAPGEVVLAFSDPVQPGLSAVSVTGADGEEHVSGTPSTGADASSVTQALRSPLANGTYRVAYRVLAADGHPVTGSFQIVVSAAASGTAAPARPPTEPTPTSASTTEGTDTGAPRPAADDSDDGDGLPVLPLVVGGLVVAGAAGLLARRLGAAPPAA